MGYKFETLKTKYGVKARITLRVSMLAPTSQCLRYLIQSTQSRIDLDPKSYHI